jgi:3,4-dihydroxy 2-butanone 4-phosphate synthase/GTP cyclohydrolase II
MEEALEDLKAGKILIVVDDEKRENEGDLVMAAEMVTPEAVNFLVTHGRGLLCMPMKEDRLNQLGIKLIDSEHAPHEMPTAFTMSVDFKVGTTTGISADDRAATVQALIDPEARPEEFSRPGHLFPLQYHPGGVLVRPGHTEAIIDLCDIAGLYPAGVVCEIMNDDGSMSRLPDLEVFAAEHGLKILSIAQIIAHRRRYQVEVKQVAEARMPTKYGEFRAFAYKSPYDPGEHVALTIGHWEPDEPVLTRIHSECLTGDVFGSMRCDCGEQLQLALKRLGQEGKGVLVYMRHEGRGIGLHNKLRAYSLQDDGADTVDANIMLGFPSDNRHYGVGAKILADLGIRKVRLLTNNPKKLIGLYGSEVEVVERVHMEVTVNEENRGYLETKRLRMGHILGSCS